MSLDLVNDAVRTAELSRKVEIGERRWRTLLENVRLLIVGLDQKGCLNYVNPFFSSVSGYSSEELLNRNLKNLVPPADVPQFTKLFQQASSGTIEECTKSRLLTKDGGRRTILWSNVLVYEDDRAIAGTLSIGTDITEQEKAEAARDDAIRKLEEMRARLEAENLYLKEEIFAELDSHDIIGQSAAIRYVVHKVHQVATTTATVLIEGETGVGKELVARAVHQASSRATEPFVRVNCAALSPTLIESELFGHEKGAFTGADRVRKGRFELADGGTLFLDEVGELPSDVQGKLLRVLQEGEFERVGDSQTRKIDVRLIAATNRDLRLEVGANRFREDLYYRLQIYPITVPPLRSVGRTFRCSCSTLSPSWLAATAK
jgi:PAS domain S-box-containing protein